MSGETPKPKSVRERLGLSKTHEWWYRNRAARGEAGKNKEE